MSIKLLITLGLILTSLNSYAGCLTPLKNVDIKILMHPIQYYYNYSSKEIQKIEGNVEPNLLGVYISKRTVSIDPQYLLIKKDGEPFCVATDSFQTIISIYPSIYISKESQQFACTKQRTEQHELMHYQFEKHALSQIKPYIEGLVQKYYGKTFYADKEEDVNKVVNVANNFFLQELKNLMKDAVMPLQAKIDNEENYKIESSYCSFKENMLLKDFSK